MTATVLYRIDHARNIDRFYRLDPHPESIRALRV
jgi:hypothetical protein